LSRIGLETKELSDMLEVSDFKKEAIVRERQGTLKIDCGSIHASVTRRPAVLGGVGTFSPKTPIRLVNSDAGQTFVKFLLYFSYA